MNLLFILLIGFILIIYLYNYLVTRSKRSTYIKAGKDWDEIVKELRKRK